MEKKGIYTLLDNDEQMNSWAYFCYDFFFRLGFLLTHMQVI